MTGVWYDKSLYKGGSFFETENYRGVSVMGCVGKVFCSVLNSRVVEYVESQGVPGYYQIAFRRKYRTSDHVMVIQTLINKYIKSYSVGQGQKEKPSLLHSLI